MEDSPRITLNVDGPEISPKTFTSALTSFYDVVKSTTEECIGDEAAADWAVSVEEGSNLTHFRALPSTKADMDIRRAIASITEEIANIEHSDKISEMPLHFDYDSLGELRDLADLGVSNKGVENIEIRRNGTSLSLSGGTVAKIDDFLSDTVSEYATFQGALESVSERRTFEFRVYNSFDESVRCTIASTAERNSLEKAVVDAFGKRVIVYGLLKYRRDGTPKSMKVEEIEVIPTDDELPSFTDMRGILSR